MYKYIIQLNKENPMKDFNSLIGKIFEEKGKHADRIRKKAKYKKVDSKKETRSGRPIKRCRCERCQHGRQCSMNKRMDESSEDSIYDYLYEYILRKGSEYHIKSKEGKTLGKYPSKKKAVKRLRQIEWFKYHK
jgi:hypothetical protein